MKHEFTDLTPLASTPNNKPSARTVSAPQMDNNWKMGVTVGSKISALLVIAIMSVAAPKIFGREATRDALPESKVAEIVAAIYRIEGGEKTKYPYGIKSIPTNGDKARAKRICENTVRNNYKRWIKSGANGNYLNYLADVYCPKSADPQGNSNWKSNIHKIVKL